MEQMGTITQLNKMTRKLETYNVHTGELIATEGCLLPGANFTYTLEIAGAICALMREGSTLTKISKTEGMPSLHLIYAWKTAHPDFAKALGDAKNDRGEYYHDKAADCVEEVDEKEDVPVGKFKFDSYMKLAEKGDPAQYGNKVQHTGAGGGALQIIVNTGIVRDQAEPIKVENIHEDSTDITGEPVSGSVSGELAEETTTTREAGTSAIEE